MGYWAAKNLHVEHAWKNDVIDIISLAADKTIIFNSTAACAHSTDLDFI
jgi:hypothetical protein